MLAPGGKGNRTNNVRTNYDTPKLDAKEREIASTKRKYHPVTFLRAIPELTVLEEKNSERSAYHGVLNLPAKLFVQE